MTPPESAAIFITGLFLLGGVLIGGANLLRFKSVDYAGLWRAYGQEFLVVAALLVPLIIGGPFFLAVLGIFAARGFYELYTLSRGLPLATRLVQSLPVFVMFIGWSLFFIGVFERSYGWPFVLFIYAVVELNDASAYIAGKLFGRKKLLPKLSPGKTVEGFVAGIIVSLCGGVAYAALVLQMENLLTAALLSMLILLGGLAGDLLTSFLKRRRQVKDFATLLPGQGGVLDIFDAFLGASIALGFALVGCSALPACGWTF